MEKTILIRNGVVIDPASGINGKYDLVISHGLVAGINAPDKTYIDTGDLTVLDAADCLITPGLIDLHTHIFPIRTSLGIGADTVGIEQGVTALVDAGSAGAGTFAVFVDEVVNKSVTQVLAWLNIADAGLCLGLSELQDLSKLDIARTVACIQQYRPFICGIKVRMSSSVLGASGIKPLEIAKKAANQAHIPLMVHIGNGPPALGDILDLLEQGDVVTHAFHGKDGGIFNKASELIPQAQRAVKRGVLLDVGHGLSSFSFTTMLKAKAIGLRPHTISTDIRLENYRGPVHSLAMTLSKFLAIGYSLEDVVTAATMMPAKVLGLSGCLGSLVIGQPANVSVMTIAQGEFDFTDAENRHLTGIQLLQPKYAIRRGKVWRAHDQ